MQVKTNLFAKNQRVINDKYREGWDRIFGSTTDIYSMKTCYACQTKHLNGTMCPKCFGNNRK